MVIVVAVLRSPDKLQSHTLCATHSDNAANLSSCDQHDAALMPHQSSFFVGSAGKWKPVNQFRTNALLLRDASFTWQSHLEETVWQGGIRHIEAEEEIGALRQYCRAAQGERSLRSICIVSLKWGQRHKIHRQTTLVATGKCIKICDAAK